MSRPNMRSTGYEIENIVSRAAIYLDDGTAATSSDIDSFDVYVFDLSSPTDTATPVYSITGQPVGATVFPFTTAGWNVDSTGYNWQLVIGGTVYTQVGGHVYRHEIILHAASSTEGPIVMTHDRTVLPMSSA